MVVPIASRLRLLALGAPAENADDGQRSCDGDCGLGPETDSDRLHAPDRFPKRHHCSLVVRETQIDLTRIAQKSGPDGLQERLLSGPQTKEGIMRRLRRDRSKAPPF